jgi:uncharacterized LabA/DUF88 family protein
MKRITFYVDGFNFYYGLRTEKRINAESRPEEKKTDVSLSIRMIGDCVQNKTDILVLVSGDSDFIPPIEFIQMNYPQKNLKIYFPPAIFSSDLSSNMKRYRSKPVFLKNNFPEFLNSRLTDVVVKDGKSYSIPEKWETI